MLGPLPLLHLLVPSLFLGAISPLSVSVRVKGHGAACAELTQSSLCALGLPGPSLPATRRGVSQRRGISGVLSGDVITMQVLPVWGTASECQPSGWTGSLQTTAVCGR